MSVRRLGAGRVRTQRGARRRGAIAVAALVLLLIVSLIAGALIRRSLAVQRQLRDDERQLQATYLAEAGAKLALRRGADEQYVGQTWRPRPGRAASSGTVEIRVEPDPDRPGKRRVHVVASFPDDSPNPAFARVTRSIPSQGAAAEVNAP